jgi:hypothetical protein
MQIHELTQYKTAQLDEGLVDTIGSKLGQGVSAVKSAGQAIASPFKDVAGSYASGRQDQKIGAMADKVYRSWKSYETQLLKADPKARENGDYEKQLLAFVNKNLLGGMYLPNVINKDKIITLVKKISAPQPVTGGAGAFGQMANQLAPAAKVGAQATTSTGGTTTTTAGGQVHTANPNNPNAKATVPPAAPATSPTTRQPAAPRPKYSIGGAPKAGAPTPEEQEKLQQKIAAAAAKQKPMNEATDPTQELFKQLVQQATLAQTSAPGTATASGTSTAGTKPASTTQPGAKQTGDARGMAQSMRQQLPDGLTSNLPAVSKLAQQLTGDLSVTSTGNPAADGMLIMMGFQGL